MNWKEREYERGKKETNYSQSAALLHIFCPFTVVKGFHGDKLPAGAALGKKGRVWGSVGDGLGGGVLLPMTGCSQAPMIPSLTPTLPTSLSGWVCGLQVPFSNCNSVTVTEKTCSHGVPSPVLCPPRKCCLFVVDDLHLPSSFLSLLPHLLSSCLQCSPLIPAHFSSPWQPLPNVAELPMGNTERPVSTSRLSLH